MSGAGLVLAAGKGTRFGSEASEPMPKVLRPVLGRPMVSYVVDTLLAAGVQDITLVVGYRSGDVVRALGDRFSYVIQDEQRGSGYAVVCAAERFRAFAGSLVVMCGDSPLVRPETVREMIGELVGGAAVVLASAVLDDPSGYGRILRDESGRIVGVVEEKCADENQRAIREVNGGAYVFDSQWLFANIGRMVENEAGEYNLTDMARVAVEQGRRVSAVGCDPSDLLGVNTPEQLRVVETVLSARQSR